VGGLRTVRRIIDVPKINVETNLYDRAKKATDAAGYSSVEEFIAHCVENELKKLKVDEAEDQVSKQLRGLGYIE
jgi:Cu/Ag efflux pump CusA